MPPKQRITREMILEKSFVMFCEEGMGVVNARSVAKALNCSTQPIFSYYSGMEDLKNSLEEKGKEVFIKSMSGISTEGSLLVNVLMAYVTFAVNQPKLFAHLFMRPGEGLAFSGMQSEEMNGVAEIEKDRNGMTIERARQLCFDMSVYAHGLATVHASGQYVFDEERVKSEIVRLYNELKK